MILKLMVPVVFLVLFSVSAFLPAEFAKAAEESIDLTAITEKTSPVSAPIASRWNLMGRVDLTSETTAPDKGQQSSHELTNRHFLVFVHVKASPKTSFMGEIVGQSFYFVDYKIRENANFQFGKIVIPFGDTRKYHHIYGGISQLRTSSIMLPNIWAESGANFQLKSSDHQNFDLYWVNSAQSSSETAEPDLKTSSDQKKTQAAGLRWTKSGDLFTLLLSVYRGEYQPGKEILLSGADAYSDYGLLGQKNLRLSVGIANASFREAPVANQANQTRSFYKRGDYIELAHRSLAASDDEFRFRYGTYIDNSETESQKDIHSFSLGYIFSLDVMKMLLEYQWNFEAISEKNNDVAKAMLSLDF